MRRRYLAPVVFAALLCPMLAAATSPTAKTWLIDLLLEARGGAEGGSALPARASSEQRALEHIAGRNASPPHTDPLASELWCWLEESPEAPTSPPACGRRHEVRF
jgi:hypothetical protein